MCWTHRNALYKGILVVNAYYDKIKNFMESYTQMESNSNSKIAVWAIKGPTFEVFGSVLRNAFFFYDFWGVQKSTKNEKSSTPGRPWALYPATFGRVGGRGGRPGKGFGKVLLVLGQVLRTGFDTPSTTV